MSEFHVEVVEIGKIGKHPNADSLSITQIHGGYPVIFKTGQFNEGDLAVYIPVDALCPTARPEFQFLKNDNVRDYEKIKAKKLRGIFSMGLLIPCPPGFTPGTNMQEALGVKKWEPILEVTTGGEQEKDPGFMPKYTDIEGLRKYRNVLVPGEEVVLTEKIHGANARYCYRDGRLWVGSHHQIKREDVSNMWWRAAKNVGLEEKLATIPDHVFYGEVYGQVQDLKYGAQPGELFLRFFDIYDIKAGRFLDFQAFYETIMSFGPEGLKMVPCLYKGPWKEELIGMCEGKSVVAAKHGGNNVIEGFVVKPAVERWDQKVGRVIFKMVGEGYHLRKQKE
jgi:RNA ligase (TIGR02306 family)